MAEETDSLTSEAAREKVHDASKRVAHFVAEKGSVAKDKVGQASKRVAVSVSKKVRGGAATGKKVAIDKLTSAGIKISQKQQSALEKLRSKYSD